ncbi:ParB/RepB/Spo0J family partition protein [Puniceibacterium sp. IMCC21224]|uniref:ParB/RepB/Spo0J family partition protein n=1 Tax=Puniceibacterium sp. IMCC21224 TaxID=1618204 RepID=UPI00064DA12E|nr:ParB N-terminal domain-containing protein [Puniceibacterium sp. IMCC21224]KMK68553.1 ParB-like nuclease [Puniceibacterium sp. IMCC21224]
MTEQMLDLALAEIAIPDTRARALDPIWAEGLAQIIAEQGLTNPITVRQTEDGFRLVTGLHRLHAVFLLDWSHIPARLSQASSDDEARLEEVMENLGRHELTALDRCHHMFELQQVYERLHPETKHGAASPKTQNLRLSQNTEETVEIFGFAEATAKAIGLSKRSIQLSVKIWKDLIPSSRLRLIGTKLASKQTELKLLSEQSSKTQVKVLDLILDPEVAVDGVQPALDLITHSRPTSDIERQTKAVSATIGRLDDAVLDGVVQAHADRLIAALKRMGRL